MNREAKLASLGAGALVAPCVWWVGTAVFLEHLFKLERGPIVYGILFGGLGVLVAVGFVLGGRLRTGDWNLVGLGAMAIPVILIVAATVNVGIVLTFAAVSALITMPSPFYQVGAWLGLLASVACGIWAWMSVWRSSIAKTLDSARHNRAV